MKKFVYELYPVSFKDSGNKGTGDLKGITEKLSYLKDLGVDYIWITPFFKSPFNDNGYDVADYYNVDPMFGTNADLTDLLSKAKELDLKIMLDMVFNHTSTEHHWFKEWKKGNPTYKDFYISKETTNHEVPTNWLSKFGGSAWSEYEPNKWFLHLYDKTQADLNWDNPLVREELKKILRHYIKLGVKGFRFDVINVISKGKYIDDNEGDGRRFYTDGPKVHDYIAEISKEFAKDDVDFLTVGELSSTSIQDSIKYANNKRTELDSIFTFHHLKVDYDGLNKFIDLKPDIGKLNDIIMKWTTTLSNDGSTMANFLTNHDQPRAVSRFIDKEYRTVGAKMLFALTSTLPGIPYIYQGEEIGMENYDFQSKDDFRDVESLNYIEEKNLITIPDGLKWKSRDNARTPMQWDASLNAGFTNGTPWINVNENYKEINVENELKNSNSVINFYKEFIKFVKGDKVINEGQLEFLPYENKVISYKLITSDKTYKLVFSFSNANIEYIYNKDNIIYTNYNDKVVNTLKPYQFIIEEI